MIARRHERLGIAGLILALVASVAAFLPLHAEAAIPSELFRFGERGTGAGQIDLGLGGGIATDPDSGHVFVSDSGNNRVSEFTAWGEFVEAWGWGVRDGSAELQTCTAATGCLKGLSGSGQGQLDAPNGIAVSPLGEVYVFEEENLRLQKFGSDGDLLQAIGGDVVASGPGDSGVNEVQEVTIAASSGTFRLGLTDPYAGGEIAQTPSLPFNASAAEVQVALNALPTIGGLGGSVSVAGGPGSATGSPPFTVTFGGALGGDDVPTLQVDVSALGPPPIGSRLVCSSDQEVESLTYRWLRNGVPIVGAESPVYTTTAADESAAIQCQAFAVNSDAGITQVANPVYVAPPEPAIEPPIAPEALFKPSGEARVGNPGSILTCDPNSASGSWQGAFSFGYTWYRNGQQIPGATENTYMTTPGDVSSPATFQCAQRGVGPGGTAATKVTRTLATSPEPRSRSRWDNRDLAVSMAPVRTLNQGGGPEVCATAMGDACKAGNLGTAPGQFGIEPLGSLFSYDYLETGADGTVHVGDRGRIQQFDADGSFKAQILLAQPLWFPAQAAPRALTVDRLSGDLLISFVNRFNPAPAYRLSPSGSVIHSLPATEVEGLATDPDGNVFLSDDPVPANDANPAANPLLREVDDAGALVDSCCSATTKDGESVDLPTLASNVVTASGESDLYVAHVKAGSGVEGIGGFSYIEIRGPAPDKWPPPMVAPTIEDQFPVLVGVDSATVRAAINPNFWEDTSYHLEYGTAPCSGGGCSATSAVELGAGVVKKPVQTAGIDLEGLSPTTTYYFRFVAESGGGGPVNGAEGTFTTFKSEDKPKACANDAFREGPGAMLGDCRAYEMVSPVEKLSGDILVIGNINESPAGLRQSSASGDKITYSSYRSFGDSESSPFTVQYLADRQASGWKTKGISPPREGPSTNPSSLGIDSQYRGFAEDLSQGWLLHDSKPALAPGGATGFQNLYRHELPSGLYETLTTAAPTGIGAPDYRIELQGTSVDGGHAIFRANAKLTATAATTSSTNFQIYEAVGGQLRLVSVRPNGAASPGSSSVGAVVGSLNNNREANVETAVSADGKRIYWSEGTAGNGRIYVRVNGVQTKAVSVGNATFWAADPNGSQAIYEEGGTLRRFDLGTESSTILAASGVQGVVGASEDLRRIYFVSTAALAGGATGGQPNLYLYEEAEGTELVATLSAVDFLPTEPSVVQVSPRKHLARVSADGSTVVFLSRTALTGADNLDAATGEPDAEVFRFDVDSGELVCVSCNPSGARTAGQPIEVDDNQTKYRVAADLPGWEFQLYAPRVISADGNRVYFESFGRLLPGDQNESRDVYQWQAVNSGECSQASSTYSNQSGGCLDLMSSGTGDFDTEFVDASADGRDVFLLTRESLVSWDPGQVDLYDAREGGGFAGPAALAPWCQGEGCQPQIPPPPPPSSPSQGAFPGNPKTKVACGRGMVRKKGRCVPKRHKKKSTKHGKGKKKGKGKKGKGGKQKSVGRKGTAR